MVNLEQMLINYGPMIVSTALPLPGVGQSLDASLQLAAPDAEGSDCSWWCNGKDLECKNGFCMGPLRRITSKTEINVNGATGTHYMCSPYGEGGAKGSGMLHEIPKYSCAYADQRQINAIDNDGYCAQSRSVLVCRSR